MHLHLEGCVPPEDIGMHPVDTDTANDTWRFEGLADFLSFLDRSCALVTSGEQVESIAYALSRRADAESVRHVDVIFNPAHWPAWRCDLDGFVARLDAGFTAGQLDFGVTAGLCLSLKRTQPAAESLELVTWLLDRRPARIVALSVDGNEAVAGRTAPRFGPLFERAKAAGLHTCAHAGESSGPEGVRDAVDVLRADRIDHGIRALEDPSLVAQLAARGTPLDVCPTSNVLLGLVPSIGVHPVEPLRRAGVRISLNTDDPLLFATSVVREYAVCASAFDWDRGVVAQVARTSIESCFAPAERRRELLDSLDRYVASAP